MVEHENDENEKVAYPLLSGERLVSVTHFPSERPSDKPSSLKQLLRLTNSIDTSHIGAQGPVLAALPREEANAPEHLRLYEAVFGRDSLRAAIDLIPSYPLLARSTIIALASMQGVTYNTAREEEPGRIIHEARDASDPIALRLSQKLGWGWPYYGSVDSTPEFIRTLTAYTQLSEENRAFLSETYIDRSGTERTIAHALESAIEWIISRQAANDEGLIEFHSPLVHGIENQVWKDSWDAYHHSDGTLANHANGIASIEVQVTTYDALIDAAELFEDILDDNGRATQLRFRAAHLREAILTYFWTEDNGGYFVLGTDRDDHDNLRQLKIKTSNMGHVLNSRILKGNEPAILYMREAVARQLATPELLAAGGIRTLARDEFRYRPGAYHNGSVWLWDTHHIAKGLRRHGYVDQANDLDDRILRVVESTRLFPEYVRGEQDTIALNQDVVILWDEAAHRENKIEQPPQEIQAWTVAAILATKKRRARI
jgi:glycogen debranching enzyme